MGEQYTDQIITFLQERWFVIAAALVILFIIMNVVKTVLKWVIVLALIAGVLFYGANYIGDLDSLSTQVIATVKNEAIKAMAGEAKDANYEVSKEGAFVITSNNLKLEGTAGSNEAKLSYRGKSLGTIKIDETIQTFITEAKKNVK